MTQQGAAPDHLQPTISAAGELSREAGARDFDVSYIFLMQTSEAEERFEAMLAEAGFDIKNPDPQLAWGVFKSFVQEPVDCADDGVLFECGTYDFTGEKLFIWGFVRQFSIDVEDEYDHMEQLCCKFRCVPTDELGELQKNLWAYDFATLQEYLSKVEELKEFKIPLQSAQNWACEVEQWKV